ncbi:hypothetical protein Acr_00g0023450 [Actinidia rufa]|uniref:Uncharacterized protein n=1 Tax=Actinidia rufa TaxID=165716 RepID=A0A7J0DEL7_9ERIC|nr:hypothetical protein Acr_00g0023450 [Actinidia rufa]
MDTRPPGNEGDPLVDTRPQLKRDEHNDLGQARSFAGVVLFLDWDSNKAPRVRTREVFQISSNLEKEQFYVVKDIVRSKAFLRNFAIDSGNMASNGGDNAKEKNVGNVVHIATDEVESRLSRGIVLPTDKETVDKLDLNMATTRFLHALSHVVTFIQIKTWKVRMAELKADKQRADEELKKFKEEYNVTIEKHEKEIAEMRTREALATTSTIDEFKASDEYK